MLGRVKLSKCKYNKKGRNWAETEVCFCFKNENMCILKRKIKDWWCCEKKSIKFLICIWSFYCMRKNKNIKYKNYVGELFEDISNNYFLLFIVLKKFDLQTVLLLFIHSFICLVKQFTICLRNGTTLHVDILHSFMVRAQTYAFLVPG